MRLLFRKKPIGDQQAFKLLLFCIGNGCSPNLICPWIMLSQAWSSSEHAERRARPINFVMNNVGTKPHSWFYCDIDYGKIIFLDGVSSVVHQRGTHNSEQSVALYSTTNASVQ